MARQRIQFANTALRDHWTSIIFCGVLQCVWFGVVMILNLHWRLAPNLFPPAPHGVFLALGLFSIAIAAAAFFWPEPFGMVATALVCGERGWQAWLTNNGYAVGVWVVFFGVTLWAEWMRYRPGGQGHG